jgi:two-component system, chemotaxis family, protein-glutamate methylesterase/glutaminase
VIKVLVVDDSPLIRKLFGRVLTEASGFEVAFARDGVEALDKLDSFQPDVITLDVNMPQMNGLDCLDRIMLQRPCPVVMVSSVTAEGADAALSALRLGAVDFISKPSGAVSLHMDKFAPAFLEKINAAASAKLPASKRLRERVQLRSAALPSVRQRAPVGEQAATESEPALGEGLVLVGTSTGGPSALETLLCALPPTFPWPILVAQHMPAGFTGPFARRLDGICALEVVEASRPMPIRAGCVYIGRGDADIVVSRRLSGLVAMAAPAKSSYPWHPSTDRLVRSAMEHFPASQLVGVLMTGMGNDGAAAMTEMRSKGGKTIAEAEETAVVWGMPGELVQAGGADWVLPLPQIANRLCKMVPSDATSS